MTSGAGERSTNRAKAIEAGELIEVPEQVAIEADIYEPLCITAAAWDTCVAWDPVADAASTGVTWESQHNRLWALLCCTAAGRLQASDTDTTWYVRLTRVPRHGRDGQYHLVELIARLDADVDGAPVLTVMLSHENPILGDTTSAPSSDPQSHRGDPIAITCPACGHTSYRQRGDLCP